MIATEKYIEKDTGFIVEIEQEDNKKWVWVYRSKADFEIGKLYRGGNVIKETETSYKYRYFIQKGSKIKTLTKDNLLGFLKKDEYAIGQ